MKKSAKKPKIGPRLPTAKGTVVFNRKDKKLYRKRKHKRKDLQNE